MSCAIFLSVPDKVATVGAACKGLEQKEVLPRLLNLDVQPVHRCPFPYLFWVRAPFSEEHPFEVV